MRLAEKPDDMAENTPAKDDDVPPDGTSPDGKAMVVFAEKPKASPPASLSANLIPRPFECGHRSVLRAGIVIVA